MPRRQGQEYRGQVAEVDWALPPLVGGKWDSLFLTTTLTICLNLILLGFRAWPFITTRREEEWLWQPLPVLRELGYLTCFALLCFVCVCVWSCLHCCPSFAVYWAGGLAAPAQGEIEIQTLITWVWTWLQSLERRGRRKSTRKGGERP